MRYRTIAGTDVEVSEVGFGVWTISAGWWGSFSDAEAVTLLRQAFDRGVTFFDTADTYGNGRGEAILAQAFPGADRDEIAIGTKFGYDWQSQIGNRREAIRRPRTASSRPSSSRRSRARCAASAATASTATRSTTPAWSTCRTTMSGRSSTRPTPPARCAAQASPSVPP